MWSKLAIGAAVLILVLFFLSVFAPMQSTSRFWRKIHQIRAVMDLASYWFIVLCAVASASYLGLMWLYGLLLRLGAA